jgi:hypothetical protein
MSDPVQRPAELVVGEAGSLQLGVGLALQFAQHVVSIGPRSKIGIGACGLAPAGVVAGSDDVGLGVGGRDQLAERVIAFSRIFDTKAPAASSRLGLRFEKVFWANRKREPRS